MLADLDRARDALHCIPADLPRDEWVRIGMAAQASGLDFGAFNDWSVTGSNYSERDARDTWRSFKPGRGIGPGTLFKTAAQYGWSPEDRQPAYFRPSRTAFQADHGRHFSVIADGVSD